jgi:hypothetical protein
MISEFKAAPQIVSDGTVATGRVDRMASPCVVDARGHWAEAASRNQIFTLALQATTGTVVAGNVIGAAAGAVTQFALWNPLGSGKNLELLRFGMGVISGTPTTGPLYHGVLQGTPTLTTSTGNAYSNLIGPSAPSVARWMASAGGSALTGGPAPTTFSVADFTASAAAFSSTVPVRCIENLDGSIVIPPGNGWLPLWSGLGTTFLTAYSITWQEVNP